MAYQTSEDLAAGGKVTAQAVSGPTVDVSVPAARREGSNLIVEGTVTRKPGADAAVRGFLHLVVTSKQGDVLDDSLIGWTPRDIPTEGARQATYHTQVLGVPPAGATIKVAYTEKVADLSEVPIGTTGGGGTSRGGSGTGGAGGSRGGSGSGSSGSGGSRSSNGSYGNISSGSRGFGSSGRH